LDSPDEEIWKLACTQLKVWCADPLSHTIFGADPGVLILSQQIAFNHQSNAAFLSESEVPSSTIDGKSAGAAYMKLQQILAPITRRAE
jgi:hypothetical protein